MIISYGDRIVIKESEGEYLHGTIVDIWRDNTKKYPTIFYNSILDY